MKLYLKMCVACLCIYPTLPHKCPECGSYDYKIVQKEVPDCIVLSTKRESTEAKSDNANQENANT
jgi:hypothetical protein